MDFFFLAGQRTAAAVEVQLICAAHVLNVRYELTRNISVFPWLMMFLL